MSSGRLSTIADKNSPQYFRASTVIYIFRVNRGLPRFSRIYKSVVSTPDGQTSPLRSFDEGNCDRKGRIAARLVEYRRARLIRRTRGGGKD